MLSERGWSMQARATSAKGVEQSYWGLQGVKEEEEEEEEGKEGGKTRSEKRKDGDIERMNE